MSRIVVPTRLLFIVGLLFWSGCSSQSGNSGESPGIRLQGAGSTFAERIIHRWAREYEKEHPHVTVRYEGVGSGEGEERFLAEKVDFGATDAGLTHKKMASVTRGVIQVPITAGIVVLAYNPRELPRDLQIPRAVYVDVFLGKKVRWNDARLRSANPDHDLPDREIQLIVRSDRSGTTFALTNHLAAISREWREQFGNPNATGDRDRGVKQVDWPGGPPQAQGNARVAGRVKDSPFSLSYIQYGAARELDLPMARLENQAGNYIEAAGTSGLETLLNARLPRIS